MGNRQPPQLHATKIKKITVCVTCLRWLFVSNNGENYALLNAAKMDEGD